MQKQPIPNKSLGQHWLTDLPSLQAMVDAAEVTKTDTVLEIGPGLGTLTELLTKQADQVVAVEYDKALAQSLHTCVKADNLVVISQDILRFDFTELPIDYKLSANIPYYLTSNLIRVLSETNNPPLVAALLVQKEVAQRVCAAPGSMSLLSVTAQFYWETSLGELVQAYLFTPPPKIDSQILILKRRSDRLFPEVDPVQFFRVVKAGFGQRRKTLLNALSAGLHLDKPAITALLQTANLDPSARAQTLSLDDWHNFYKVIETSVVRK
jgi:16S rRNA (adenine1518-N6/adenine1519-N6)-dimethyltransferase